MGKLFLGESVGCAGDEGGALSGLGDDSFS
jgi:hypothetical protein